MATRQQVRDAMHTQPFRGFTIKLSDGRTFFIHHPDFIAVPANERGRDVTVNDREGTHRIDLLHIVEVSYPDLGETATSPAGSPAEDNGA
jgi:hypothetical protein